MYKHTKTIRVRYGETDRMGYVYYGNYALYFEEGRTDAIRQLGMSYKQMEDEGIILPVVSYNVKFKNPAFYDDVLTLETIIPELPEGVRIKFQYKMLQQDGKLICEGETVLAFIDSQTGKPVRIPGKLQENLKPFFE